MSKFTANTVCRLLGGSGQPQRQVAPAKKLAALCSPAFRSTVDVVVSLPQPLPLAA